MDVPLSEAIFYSRLRLLRTEQCHYYLTNTQLKVLRLLYSKEGVLKQVRSGPLDEEKRLVDAFVHRKKENAESKEPAEEINIDGLNEKEIHSLFYQNEESQVVEADHTSNFVEIDLEHVDAEGLENLEEELEQLEQQEQQGQSGQSEQANQVRYGYNAITPCVVGIPMMPLVPMESIFNPFFNPGALHCYSNQYSFI